MIDLTDDDIEAIRGLLAPKRMWHEGIGEDMLPLVLDADREPLMYWPGGDSYVFPQSTGDVICVSRQFWEARTRRTRQPPEGD